jgi:two-component system, cell cycle response regulator
MSAPKILSVDDSRMIHMLITKGFASYDVQLCFASNGAEGLEVAAKEKPDAILLDVTMPVMDGVECLGKLKADPSLKDIPVIMLTAEAGKENVLKIARMGVRDYIVKPFTEDAVIDRISRIVDLKKKGDGPAAPAPAAATKGSAVEAKKTKVVTDAIRVMVVDEHPAIIESITKAVKPRGWEVVGCAGPDEAKAHVGASVPVEKTPDVVLVSLAYPNKGGLKLFADVKANPALKNVPLLGMAVKTATFEMGEARDTGFSGTLTKPLDLGEVADRIARAMDLDITPLFYKGEADAQVLTIDQSLSDTGSVDLVRQSRAKLADFVNAGISKLVVDLDGVKKFDIPILRAAASIVAEAAKLDIQWRIVGSDMDNLPNLPTLVATNQKVAAMKDVPNPFKGDLQVFPDVAAALADF